jgi:secondary thiamine-phosphate synthase enzyme
MSRSPQPSTTDSPHYRVYHEQVDLRTQKRIQFVDLTELVTERVLRSGITHGTVQVQTRHTTTAIVINENEPLLIQDMEELLELWAPSNVDYRHDDLRVRHTPFTLDERVNGDAHARAILLGSSQSLNVVDGRIDLGRWQRIFLVDLDGPRKRSTSILVMGVCDDTPAQRESPLSIDHAQLRGVS